MVLVQMEYKSAISVLIQSAYLVATRERKCIMTFCSTIYSSEHSIVPEEVGQDHVRARFAESTFIRHTFFP